MSIARDEGAEMGAKRPGEFLFQQSEMDGNQ